MSVTDRPRFARNKFSREKKQLKRQAAAERQAVYDALTPAQKLAKLDRANFAAVKERAKIAALTAKAPVVESSPEKKGAEGLRKKKAKAS